MDMRLDGKTALVTGSTTGIGREIARRFAREGVSVIVNGRTRDRVDRTVAELKAEGKVHGITADVSSLSDVEELCRQAEKIGPVDILVNNVGIFEVKPFVETTDEEWMHYFNVNFMSAVRLSRALLPGMLSRNRGSIIMIASEAGVKPMHEMVHYSVTKTALIGLARGLAELTKGTDVNVNSVLVGPTWTDGARNYFEGISRQEERPLEEVIREFFEVGNPTSLIQRFIKVEEVASLILTITSVPAINGSAQRVEGGIIRSIL